MREFFEYFGINITHDYFKLAERKDILRRVHKHV
jgi:hypothetical protein